MTEFDTEFDEPKSMAKFMEILRRHAIGAYLEQLRDAGKDVGDHDPVLNGDVTGLMLSHNQIKRVCREALHFL
jgi:hypothetical protein